MKTNVIPEFSLKERSDSEQIVLEVTLKLNLKSCNAEDREIIKNTWERLKDDHSIPELLWLMHEYSTD